MESKILNIKLRIPPYMFYNTVLPNFHVRSSRGWIDGGLCPFHDDKHAGSFRVNLDTGAFKCFSCGARGGDIIDFVCKRDGKTIPQALDQLSHDWGV